MEERKSVIPAERIEKRIFFLRGQKVMLSVDLAELYCVEPRALVQAVKRNTDRFLGPEIRRDPATCVDQIRRALAAE